MPKPSKIVFMCPVAPPVTGQSTISGAILNNIKNRFRVIHLNTSNKDNIFSGLTLCINIIYTIFFQKADLVYFTCSRSFKGSLRDIVLLTCCRLKSTKVINHLHGNDFGTFYQSSSKFYKSILQWCYEQVSSSIILINGMQNNFTAFPKMKLNIIANSYPKYLDELPLIKISASNKIRLLFFSNILESKGIFHLLDAFDKLCKDTIFFRITYCRMPYG